MFRQTDPAINPMAKWGCYFCSILALSEKVSKKTLSADEALGAWSKNCVEGDIDHESTVENVPGLLADLPGNLEFVGKRVATYATKADEYEILLFYNTKTKVSHFVLGDGAGNCAWDPWENSRTVREGELIGKRIFRGKP